MNHIHRLMQERDEALATIREAREQLTDLQRYLTSVKFSGPGNDYVHIRTDVLPKIMQTCFTLIEGKPLEALHTTDRRKNYLIEGK